MEENKEEKVEVVDDKNKFVDEKSNALADKFGGKNVGHNSAAIVALAFAVVAVSMLSYFTFHFFRWDWVSYLVAFIICLI